ncbi:MAG: helix-turn-helix transcriptional regulator [Planctomycetes bacterium]|nr:helix-turn-helix transcriptional regulator [Planctomycetota bacterium]MBI3846333.1 helix-turn-helix transcriptional regulator [Planctomycetota bacterium]
MRELMAVTKALSDLNRVRILGCLQGGELCVCQIIELLGLAASTTSKHLAILKHARLIESRKDARWMHYRLADPDAPKVVHDALRWVSDAISREKQADDDAKRLKAITRIEPEALCCRQRRATTRRSALRAR